MLDAVRGAQAVEGVPARGATLLLRPPHPTARTSRRSPPMIPAPRPKPRVSAYLGRMRGLGLRQTLPLCVRDALLFIHDAHALPTCLAVPCLERRCRGRREPPRRGREIGASRLRRRFLFVASTPANRLSYLCSLPSLARRAYRGNDIDLDPYPERARKAEVAVGMGHLPVGDHRSRS